MSESVYFKKCKYSTRNTTATTEHFKSNSISLNKYLKAIKPYLQRNKLEQLIQQPLLFTQSPDW